MSNDATDLHKACEIAQKEKKTSSSREFVSKEFLLENCRVGNDR